MSVFNDNIRFLRKKLRFSQQRLADDLGEKRGKIAAYEDNTDARPEFYKKIADHYQIDLHRFLTIKMTEETYSSFFKTSTEGSFFSEPRGEYASKSEIINRIQELKKENDQDIRSNLSDEITSMVVRLIEENGMLRKEILELHKKNNIS